MTLRIGRRSIPIASLAEASRKFAEIRDTSGKGASSMPEGKVIGGDREYRVSYNGKIWDGADLIFNPYAT